MTTPDLTAADCERIFHAALGKGDAKGVEAALVGVAVRDPHRAQDLLDITKVALKVADDPTLRPVLLAALNPPRTGGSRMTEHRTEWAAEVRYYDGTTKHAPGGDEDHAGLIADGITTHIESLNQPTREDNGVESAVVVCREVTVEDDGTTILRPWQEVRPGAVVA